MICRLDHMTKNDKHERYFLADKGYDSKEIAASRKKKRI
jgi:hypothetical protein